MNAGTAEIWVVDDDPSLRFVMSEALKQAGYEVRAFSDPVAARAALTASQPRVLVTDVRLPGEDGFSLLRELRAHAPALPVIVVTAHSDLASAVAAYQGGAFEYLPKPFDIDEFTTVVARALQSASSAGMRSAPSADDSDRLIGESPAMQTVFRSIGRLAGTNLTVLITGESGTGKELVARALHRHSRRRNAPFIALNTAAIPAELLESELFGHERGAFTGANARRFGRFEQAHGGTLFLDEIGDMPAALQTRLLRVLAEGEFYRVGGHEPVRAEVRVIAATHQDLAARVREGAFREDLFHRLNVVTVHLPALRERREDIPLLLEHFMQLAARELELEPKRLTAEAMQVLREREWRGNVRELANFCRRLALLAPGRIVHKSDLEALDDDRGAAGAEAAADWQQALRRWTRQALAAGEAGIAEHAIAACERVLIEAAMEASGGRRQEAARRLGIGRNTLARKLKGGEGGD